MERFTRRVASPHKLEISGQFGSAAHIPSVPGFPIEMLVDQIAKALVDDPQQVSVSTLNGDHTTVLELRVAKSDLGKVIGKQGRTAQAMRTLLSAVSSKERKRTVLEIIE